jgi:hypothetical protein
MKFIAQSAPNCSVSLTEAKPHRPTNFQSHELQLAAVQVLII